MIKLTSILAALSLLLFAFPIEVRAAVEDDTVAAFDSDTITADAAVLIDMETGQILFDKNMNKIVYPASTTKIMTGLIAVEQCFPGDIVTVTESAVDISEPASSNIALTPGEELPLEEAMYALMLPSANDAANVIAEHVAGSQEEFVKMMNAKAKAIGAVNTNFVNAHGLHENDHYTTAYDMAIITGYAAGDDLFMRYFGAGLHTMPATNLQESERPFTNYQYMLVEGTRFYDENVIGGKVGYTTPAKHTMSTVATKDGRTLICVVMGCGKDQKFTDTQALFDFGFDEFEKITIPKEEADRYIVPINEDEQQVGDVLLFANSDLTFLLHNSLNVSAVRFAPNIPDVFVKGEKINASISLVADAEDESILSLLITKPLASEVTMIKTPVSAPQDEESVPNNTLKAGWIIGISAVFMIIAVVSLLRYRRYRRRKARLARLNRRIRELSSPSPSQAGRARSYSYMR